MAKPTESDGSASMHALVETDPNAAIDARGGLRLMLYDKASMWRNRRPDLGPIWAMGALLYRALRRIDAYRGVRSWAEGIDWLANVRPEQPIREVQFWGHGLWGSARIGSDALAENSLCARAPDGEGLRRVARRMTPDSLWWFRTCQTFGARPGQRFAAALANHLGCRVAGHTFIIGHWQSGLHTLDPGCTAEWCDREGLARGTPESPEAAAWSTRRAPNTISFLQGRIPAGY